MQSVYNSAYYTVGDSSEMEKRSFIGVNVLLSVVLICGCNSQGKVYILSSNSITVAYSITIGQHREYGHRQIYTGNVTSRCM